MLGTGRSSRSCASPNGRGRGHDANGRSEPDDSRGRGSDRALGAISGRADRRHAPAHRPRRQDAERLHHGVWRAGPRGRAGGREDDQGRLSPGASARHSHRHQGQHLHARRAHDRGVQDPGGFRAPGRRHGDRASEAGRRGDHRQDEPARVRLGRHHRQPALWHLSQSVEPRALPGGVERRVGSRRRGADLPGRSAPTPAAPSGCRRR